jgi:hypothetical protein
VVEVQHDDVRLTAVDTGMRTQVLTEERAVLLAVTPDPRHLLLDVGVAVP